MTSRRGPGARARTARVRDGVTVPRGLVQGDIVGVMAPGSAPERDALKSGIGVLRRMGLRVRTGSSINARSGSFAGSDTLRARDLAEFISDDDVRAIFFARGGWGTSRLLTQVPWKRLAGAPKILIGYSDLTALFAPVLDRCRLSCVYGPVVAELGRRAAFDRASLERALFRPAEPIGLQFRARDIIASGTASGRIAGGCLTLLAHLAGTAYAPDLKGKTLLIEEIEEAPYRIDRMLTQMSLAGMLDGIRAVLVGSLTGCVPRKSAGPSPSARDVIASHFARTGVPVVAGLAIGHTDRKLSIPLGFRAEVDTRRRRVLLEP